jgi:UDP-glucose 4-epimerase
VKVLVTGGAGYIGAHTVQELKRSGYEVVVLDTLERGNAALVDGVNFVQGDINDAALLDRLFRAEKFEAVMDFAAYKAPGESIQQPLKYFQNNVGGVLTLIQTMVAHDVHYYIFSSSCSVFGNPRNLPASETNNGFAPESPYAESKLAVERFLRWFEQAYNLRYIALRYFNAAGAALDGSLGEDWNHTQNLIPLTLKAAAGVSPAARIFGTDYPTPDGTAIRDFVHVVDLAVAHVQALQYLLRTDRSGAYNLGTGKGTSIQTVVDTAKRVSGVDFKVEKVARRPGDPVAIWADPTKAQQELGWQPRYDLDTIIETAWNWHSRQPR